MKKATLKTYLIVLLVLLLSIALTLTAFACSKKPGETPEENEPTSDFTSVHSFQLVELHPQRVFRGQ